VSASAPELRVDESSLERVLSALGDRVTRTTTGEHGRVQAYALCPAHPDHKPSLSVTWKDDPVKGGRVLMNCRTGCEYDAVLSALNLRRSDMYDTPPTGGTASSSTATRSTPPPPAPASKTPTKRRPTADKPAVWLKESEHIYADADGVPVFRVTRFLPGSAAKYLAHTFDRSGRRISQKGAPAFDRRVLYNLPAVVAAIKAGGEVWVVEGEKDADAAIAAGLTATTNAFGAAIGKLSVEKWLPQYTESLRGAHVVLVPDLDTASVPPLAGYRHVLHVAAELEGVAASVRVVAAAEGKDPHDHLVTAGLPVDAFVPLELSELQAAVDAADAADAADADPKDVAPVLSEDTRAAAAVPAPVPADDDPADDAGGQVLSFPGRQVDHGQDDDDRPGGGGGGGGGTGGGSGDDPKWKRVEIRDHFEARPNGLFKVNYKVTETERLVQAKELLPVAVRMSARMTLDVGDGEQPELSHVDLIVSRDGVDHEMRSIDRRRWESCSWVGEMPWPATYDSTTNGKSQLVKAITATSGDVPLTTMYGALGWQEINGKWLYLTAAGALGTDGPVEGIRVKTDSVLDRFTLSTPPVDLAELKAAIGASTALLYAVPARISAALLGAAYRAPLGFSRSTVMTVGSKSSGKTGLSGFMMQHYDPTARHDSLPGAGAGEDAGTVPGLEELRYKVGDMLLSLDDVAPDKGVERASVRVALIARSQYNRTGKIRMRRDGGMRAVHAPRSLPLVSGEESTAVESADSRIVLLNVGQGDVDVTNVMPALDQGEEPELRAKLIAAMVTYYAKAMPMTAWLRKTRDQLTLDLMDPNPSDPAYENLDKRHSGSVADLATGWRAMLDMATARGALTEAEAGELWEHAWTGLTECKRRLMDGSAKRTAADRVRELLTSMFVLKRVALDSKEGGAPINPERYGWEAESSNFGPGYRKPGDLIGWTNGTKVWLRAGAAYPALTRQGEAEKDPITYSKNRLGDALADAGVLRTRMSKDDIRRTTVSVRVGPDQQPVECWELDHDWLFGGDGDDDSTTSTTPTTPPPPPAAPITDAPAPVEDQPKLPLGAAEAPAEPVTPSSAGIEPSAAPDSSETPSVAPAKGRRYGARANAPKFPGLGLVADLEWSWLIRPHAAGSQPARLQTAGVDLAAVLERAAGLGLGHVVDSKKGRPIDAGQVWITSAVRKALKWPASLDEDSPKAQLRKVAKAITDAGWRLEYKSGKPSRVGFWMQIRRGGNEVLDLVVADWFTTPTEFQEDRISAETLALRLGRYAHHSGVAFQWTPAVTGLQLAAATRPKLIRNGRPELPPPAMNQQTEGRFGSRRKPTAEEQRHKYVHLLDFNGAYLGASRSLSLPWGEYVHVERPAVDLKRPGYWLVDLPKWDDARLFDPFVVDGRNTGKPVWITTPTLEIAVKVFDLAVEPLEGYLAAEYLGGTAIERADYGDRGSKGWIRLLEPWAERLGAARTALTPADPDNADPDDVQVRKIIKATYAEGYGRFAVLANRNNNHPLYRPDIRHMIQAQARLSIMLKVMKAAEESDRYPIALTGTDAIVYTSDSIDPKEAFPPGFKYGEALGEFTSDGVAPMEPLLGMLNSKKPLEITVDGTLKKLGLSDAIRHFNIGGN
jgi:hypothetical protein